MKQTIKVTSIALLILSLPYGEFIPVATALHSSDTSSDFVISVSEMMRVIQLYNEGEYHCDADAEDGFAPGAGDQSCARHDADYAPQDWKIDLSELLRVLQMYNLGMYSECDGTEDGFCPGSMLVSEDVRYIPSSSLGDFDGENILFGLFDSGTGSVRIYLQDGSSKLFVFDEGAQ